LTPVSQRGFVVTSRRCRGGQAHQQDPATIHTSVSYSRSILRSTERRRPRYSGSWWNWNQSQKTRHAVSDCYLQDHPSK